LKLGIGYSAQASGHVNQFWGKLVKSKGHSGT